MAMKTVTAREANQQFSRLLGEVAEGEEVVITRRGQPVATLAPYRGRPMTPERKAAIERMMALARRASISAASAPRATRCTSGEAQPRCQHSRLSRRCDAGERHQQAVDPGSRASSADCVLTLQSLGEFFHVVTRKGKLSPADARPRSRRLRAAFPVQAAKPDDPGAPPCRRSLDTTCRSGTRCCGRRCSRPAAICC